MIFFYPLLAFLLSTGLLRFNHVIATDGVSYVRMAENIFGGKGISVNPGEPFADRPPFYPVLIGLANFLLRDWELSGSLISILAFSLTAIPLYRLAQDIYPGETKHWVGFLWATHGFLLAYSNLIMSEPLFIFLVVIELYFLQRITQRGRGSISSGILLGILGGLSYLTRPEGLLYYVAGALFFLWFSTQPLSLRVRAVLLSLATFLVFFVPYVHFVHQTTHKWQFSGLAIPNLISRQLDVANPGEYLELKKMYQGLTVDKTRIKMEELTEDFDLLRYLTKDHFALLRSGPPSMVPRLLGLNKYLFGGLGFFLIGASLFARPWGKKRRRSELLLIFFLAPFLSQVFLLFDNRRYLPLFPILLLWVGDGLEVSRNWAKETFSLSKKASWGVVLSLGLVLALSSAIYLQQSLMKNPPPLEDKELGLWMRQNIPGIEKERVASRSPSVNFYSGSKLLWVPYTERLEDLLAYLTHHGAKYFVISTDLDHPALDAYRFLLDEIQPPPLGILKRHTVVRGDRKIILYEIQ